jgi:hypothetical protein
MTFRVTAHTLVDITETGIRRVRDSNTLEYHQQQNLNVLMQTIGIRTQIFDPNVKLYPNMLLTKDSNMGEVYRESTVAMWTFTFNVETEAIWNDGVDDLAFLKQDVHGVAITSDLNNTVDFPVNMFDTSDNINITFQIS